MGDLRVFKGSFWGSIKVPLKRSIAVPKRDLWGFLKGVYNYTGSFKGCIRVPWKGHKCSRRDGLRFRV